MKQVTTSSATDSIEKRRQIVASLEDREYRHAMVEQHIAVGIPMQIRALREREGWTQKESGARSGQAQTRISLLEKIGYEGYTVKTLCKIAATYDVALIVKFAPFSELIDRMANLSSDDILVARYSEDTHLNPIWSDDVINFLERLSRNQGHENKSAANRYNADDQSVGEQLGSVLASRGGPSGSIFDKAG